MKIFFKIILIAFLYLLTVSCTFFGAATLIWIANPQHIDLNTYAGICETLAIFCLSLLLLFFGYLLSSNLKSLKLRKEDEDGLV